MLKLRLHKSSILYEDLLLISVRISSNELKGSEAKVFGDIISGVVA